MNIEIVNTGSELLLGRVLNTHQQWLCRQLADCGYLVQRQIAVADSPAEITRAVRESLGRAELVITTGGLGPTSDDLTRDAVAELLGRQLTEDSSVVAHIAARFAARNRPLPASTRVQALVPAGAVALPNAHGTAPGLVMELDRNCLEPVSIAQNRPGMLIMLPGPPRELRPMFLEQALPLIQQRFPVAMPYVCHTLRTTGLGESLVQERIAEPLRHLLAAGLEIGYCARPGEVDVRLAVRGSEATRIVGEAETIARARLGPHIYGQEEETLASVVVRLLTERKQTLVLAESCTGGNLAGRLTDVPGASTVFLGGLVTYSNELKQSLLGVGAGTLTAHGAVSETTAGEMAEGARTRYHADYALAVTGIAGPGGGTEAKPVGTVYVALATARGTVVVRQLNRYDRETFKHITSQQALEMLRRELLGATE